MINETKEVVKKKRAGQKTVLFSQDGWGEIACDGVKSQRGNLKEVTTTVFNSSLCCFNLHDF